MSSGKKRQTFLVAIVLLLLVGLTIGYAVLSAQLNITGVTTIEKAVWDIHFDSVSVTDGSVTGAEKVLEAANIDSRSTKISYKVKLGIPGDFYEFTAVITNHGTLDAKLESTPTITGVSTEQDVYTNYSVTYLDGTEIKEGDVLNHGESVTVKVRVEYDKVNINTNDDLPHVSQTLDLVVDFDYIQK